MAQVAQGAVGIGFSKTPGTGCLRKILTCSVLSSCPVGKRKDVDDDADASNPRGSFRWKRTPLGAFPAFSDDFLVTLVISLHGMGQDRQVLLEDWDRHQPLTAEMWPWSKCSFKTCDLKSLCS